LPVRGVGKALQYEQTLARDTYGRISARSTRLTGAIDPRLALR
jgi:hypothetical protein